jgi:drug/metabolite transporter (DMT)-like permease
MRAPSIRMTGILLVLASAILWSTAGVFVRMAELDIWSIVAWRSLFAALALGLFAIYRRSQQPASKRPYYGKAGILASLMCALASIFYISALSWTTVANVMTIYATLPFMASAIAFLWLGERTTLRFLIAGSIALTGVIITVSASFNPQDLLGISAALVMTLAFAAQLVFARRYPGLDMPLMTCVSALLCFLVALPWIPLQVPDARALLACALYGIFSTGISYVLVLMGSRLIGSGEAALLSLLDVVLGPIWVWLFFDEYISAATLFGGSLVLMAVIGFLLKPTRKSPSINAQASC